MSVTDEKEQIPHVMVDDNRNGLLDCASRIDSFRKDKTCANPVILEQSKDPSHIPTQTSTCPDIEMSSSSEASSGGNINATKSNNKKEREKD